MTISVFIPAHITGFFSIENNQDPLKNGSCGAGFLLDRGVKTTLKDSSEFKININQGTDIVINEVLKHFNIDSPFEITQDIQLPIGAGFGTSAASALSLSMALNEFFDCGYSYDECGQIAHKVEVSLGGGLGDVIGQTGSGLVLRTSPGAPGVGRIESFDEDLFVATRFFGGIDTASIIQNPNHKRVISETGHKCLEEFKKDISVSNNNINKHKKRLTNIKKNFNIERKNHKRSQEELNSCCLLDKPCDKIPEYISKVKI